jgi:hypothetical protein
MAKDRLLLLTLKTLDQIGEGNLDADFAQTLQGLVRDCMARPAIKKTREVSIVFKLTPIQKNDGTCDDVTVVVQVASKAPAKIIEPYQMRATINGGLKFAPDSPGNPDQGTLDMED